MMKRGLPPLTPKQCKEILDDIIEHNKSKDGPDKCVFCGTIWGALIRLHQGWCCVDCFKKYVLKEGQTVNPESAKITNSVIAFKEKSSP